MAVVKITLRIDDASKELIDVKYEQKRGAVALAPKPGIPPKDANPMIKYHGPKRTIAWEFRSGALASYYC